MFNVREAVLADLDQIVSMISDMRQDSRYSCLSLDEKKLSDFVYNTIESDSFLVLTTDYGGVFIGCVSPHFFSQDLIATDVVNFVPKSLRGKGLGKVFLEEFSSWAKGANAKLVQVGISTGIKSEKVFNMYESAGFKHFGYLFEVM